MNLEQFKEFLETPKAWLIINITFSVIFGFGYIWYETQQRQKENSSFEEQILTEKKQKKQLVRELLKWQQNPELPLLKKQVTFAKDYFSVYGLEVALGDKVPYKNYQEMVVDGPLSNLVLAVYDLNHNKLLVNYGNIIIGGGRAALSLNILGRGK
jgi:hypothetical protein